MQAIPVYSRGMWQHLVAYKHVLCPDGIRRRARITSEADTFFTVPASVTVAGRTVTGYITDRGYEYPADRIFVPNLAGRNASVFYRWLDYASRCYIDRYNATGSIESAIAAYDHTVRSIKYPSCFRGYAPYCPLPESTPTHYHYYPYWTRTSMPGEI